MMMKANKTRMKKRIGINRVASKSVFQPGIQTVALHYTMSVCDYSSRGTQFARGLYQRDVTDMKRSGEWLNMESRNLVIDSRCVNLCKRSFGWTSDQIEF